MSARATKHMTRLERVTLGAFFDYHTSGISLWRVYRRKWKDELILLLLGTFSTVGFILTDQVTAGVVLAAVVVTNALREVLLARDQVRIWPLYDQIIDWGRAEEVLREHGQPSAN
jgi:hypothetical protein